MTDLSLLHRLFRLARIRQDHPMMEVWEHSLHGDQVVRGKEFSYQEVGDLVVRKAREFARYLPKESSLVGIHLPPGPGFVVNDLALMLAGKTPVLIDHLLPPESVKNLLSSFQIRTLITEDVALITFLGQAEGCLLLSGDLPEPGKKPENPDSLLEEALPEGDRTIAHLLLTSGTTGEPKGVSLSHRNLLFDADAALSYGVFTERDRILSVLPLHHSYPFMTGFLLPFSAGGTILFPPDLSPASLVGVMKRGKVTIFPAVPLLWERFHQRMMEEIGKKPPIVQWLIHQVLLPLSFTLRRRFGTRLGALPFRAVRRRFGPRMKALFSGGAPLSPEITRDFFSMGLTMLEGYGLTETSPVVSTNTPSDWRVGTVGPPLPGVEIRVLPPEEGRPGGKILVRGPNVATCWWFPGGMKKTLGDSDGWFDTGDLGFLSEGHLTLVGREKELIVLPNGKNIFPESLEMTLVKEGLLAEAAVFQSGKALVALLRPEPLEEGVMARLKTLLEEINRKIPPHSRIAAFEVADEPFPRTRLGKLRRFMLPGIYREIHFKRLSSHPSKGHDTPMAARIRERIRAFSGIAEAVPDGAQLEADLGIDSLGRVELLQELEEILGQEMPDELLEGIVTVGDLLDRISKVAGSPMTESKGPDTP